MLGVYNISLESHRVYKKLNEKHNFQSKFCVGLGYPHMHRVRSDHMQFEEVCDISCIGKHDLIQRRI